MRLPKNTTYYFFVALIFLLLKYTYTVAGNNQLLFLLAPTNYLVEMATNSKAIYSPHSGFYHISLNIVIDTWCSGFNFWILCFAVTAVTSVQFLTSTIAKLLNLPLLLLLSYLLTIFVNTSRICISVLLQKPAFTSIHKYEWLHEAEGVFVYLSFLIAFYFVIRFLYAHLNPPNEKPAQS